MHCMVAHLPVFGHSARRWINHGVCDAWPVWPQTHSVDYLPSLCWYQIYTAWWQLAAQDINPIAYAVTRLNSLDLTSCTGPDLYPVWYADKASEHVFSIAIAHATTTTWQPDVPSKKRLSSYWIKVLHAFAVQFWQWAVFKGVPHLPSSCKWILQFICFPYCFLVVCVLCD